MYLKSTIPVTYNNSTTTSVTVIMTGTLEEIYMKVGSAETKLVYNYTDVDGGVYAHTDYILTDEEKDALYPLIKDNLPDINVVGEAAYDLAMYYEGFRYKMAEEFAELTFDDIELIQE